MLKRKMAERERIGVPQPPLWAGARLNDILETSLSIQISNKSSTLKESDTFVQRVAFRSKFNPKTRFVRRLSFIIPNVRGYMRGGKIEILEKRIEDNVNVSGKLIITNRQ